MNLTDIPGADLVQQVVLADDRVPRAIYSITLNGKNITKKFDGRLISMTLQDNRGFEADQLDISLDDADGALEIPSRGVTLKLSIGWAGAANGLVDKGEFMVDEVRHTGTPDVLTIRARSVDLRAGLSIKKERSWHRQTVGAIVRAIASQNKVEARISKALDAQLVDHIDQTAESDANLLSRLAKMFDAIATVKNGLLLFIKAGEATTASGKPLPAVTITRDVGDRHEFGVADRDTYSGVQAFYLNTRTAKKQSTTVKRRRRRTTAKKKPIDKSGDVLFGTAENVKTLRHTYANKGNATRAAKAEWEKLQRGVAEFSIVLALGRPELMTELPVTVRGYKRVIDDCNWIIARVTHSIDGNGGFTSDLDLEVKATEVPEIDTSADA
ncbi:MULTISPECIES: phage late control D family protein [Burkholderia]|uniref:phage late control D family protein n=1 Tax=Burkholderia TaxID=32008 RepID=UPI00064FB3CF|nr:MULTISPECIES: phage late control D family protein [Burkholderia]KML20254.1 late control protein D [Burkholderia cepacia]KML38267.1 late control protein D [Burkholderia lata]KMN61919.1 late control protein D [Burkholderia sp. LK4]